MAEDTSRQTRRPPKKGIQRKLVRVTLLVGALPVLSGLLLTYLKGTSELQQAIGANFTGLAREAGHKADLIINGNIRRLQNEAASDAVVELVRRGDRAGRTSDRHRREWEEARDSRDPNHPLLRNPIALRLQHATQVSDTPDSIVGMFITNRQGNLLASVNHHPPFAAGDTELIRSVTDSETGQPYIGNIHRQGDSGQFVFEIGIPIIDPDNRETIGTLVQVADVKEYFKSAINEIRFGKTGHAMLIDGNGNVLVCPILPTGMHVSDPVLLEAISNSTAHWAIVENDAHGGSDSIIGASPLVMTNRVLAASDSHRWFSFIRQAPAELYAPVRTLLRHAVIASVLLLALLGILAVFFSRRFVRPIHTLHEGAEIIGSGNFHHRLAIRTNDEIEQLADEFNQMAGNLRNFQGRLETRVNERTNELRVLNAMSITVNQSLDLQKTLDDTLSQVMEVMGAEGGVIHHWDSSRSRLFVRSHKGLSEDLIRKAGAIQEGEFVSGQVARQGKMLIIDDSNLAEFSTSPLIQDGFRSILGIPIYSKSNLVATMVLASRTPRHFGTSGIQLLSSIVNQIGTAIDHAALYTREKKMVARLKEIDKFKSDFLSNVSHELRMPLTSIIGFSELLLDRIPGELTPDQEDYIQNMQESGYHLLEIINNLLNLSKIRAGKMEVRFEQFGLAHLLENIERTISPLVSKKGLRFSSEMTGELPDLFSDEGKIKQILLNLLSNAIKFTPAGGSIRVQASPSALDGRSAVEIRVSDTGIGIRPEDKAKIFDEFQQLDASYTRDYPGSGLGLSISRQFCALIGGHIAVESQYGKGSTFIINIPVQPAAEDDLALPMATPSPGTELPQAVQIPSEESDQRVSDDESPLPRILVVEDDPTVGRLLTLYLTQEGYHVDHAMDGEEAIEKAILLKPFAITLDVMLPRIDGWEVLQRLKQNKETKDIPIIIVSIIENRDLGFSLGATDYFTKPIDRKGLLDSLKKLNLTARTRRKPVNILVVDDDTKILKLIAAILETEGYGVLKAQDAVEGINLAIEIQPDLILMDLLMPGISGFEALERLKQHPTAKNIPVIVFTGRSLSSEDRERINTKIRGMIQKGTAFRQSLLSEIQKFEKLYPDKAKMVDGLTGFYNERYLQNRLSDESSRALRIQRGFSLLLANIDAFKSINRRHGLETGNIILQGTADLIRKNSRSANPLCRCGGSTIAIILTETTKDTAVLVGEKLRRKIEEAAFTVPSGGKKIQITVSIGLATFFEDANTPEKLMTQATWALDQARILGGNQIVSAKNLPNVTEEREEES